MGHGRGAGHAGVGWVMLQWGGVNAWWWGAGHAGVGWVMQRWGGVGHVGVWGGGLCRGGVG